MGKSRPLFIFGLFKHKLYRKKLKVTAEFELISSERIQTQIVGVESEHADHLTSTTAHKKTFLALKFHNIIVNSSL